MRLRMDESNPCVLRNLAQGVERLGSRRAIVRKTEFPELVRLRLHGAEEGVKLSRIGIKDGHNHADQRL